MEPSPDPAKPPAAEGEAGLRLILESIQDFAVFTVDPAGTVLTWNPGAERLFGWTGAEIIGQSARVLWTAEDQAAGVLEQELETVRAKGCADDVRWRVRKDGSRLFVEGVVRPLLDAEGHLRGFTKVCRDAAEQREKERQLAQSRAEVTATAEVERARLADLFNRSPAFLAVLRGPQCVFERTNEQYQKLIGHREVIGRTFREGLPEMVVQGFADLLETVYRTGEPYVGSNTHVRLERTPGQELEERVVDFMYLPLREADGSVSGVYVHGVDLTERRHAEGESRRLGDLVEQQVKTFDVTLSHINDCVYTFDLQHRLTYVNRATLELWGRTQEEMLGKRLEELGYAPEMAEAVDAELREVVLTGQPIRGTTLVPSPGGGTRSLEHIFTPVFGEAHAVVAVAGTSRDVTEQKRVLEALRESQQRFDLTVEGAKLGTFHWDLPGMTDLNWNARMREFFWLPAGRKVVLPTVQARMHPEDRPRVSATLERVVRGEGRYDEEYRVLGPKGEVRWLHVIGEASRNPEGRLDHFTGLAMDISRQKFAEQEREALLDAERAARSDAERASRMKDEFLATLSHELRTPLNAMLGWAKLLHEGPNTPEDLEMGLEIIERNARSQKQIIEDLLDMSRIISGKVRLDVQRFDLKPAVEAAIETVRPAAAAKGIRLQAVLDPTARPVSGDPNRMQQIFWNLLSNAIKFTPKDGRVQVLLERVNSHLEVSVIDNGPGIAPEFLPFLFDRFRQADSSITRQHGGLGLGLAIVKQLVELHGGNVRVRSGGTEPGSTFIVSLPLTVMHAETRSGIPASAATHEPTEERRHPQAGGGGPTAVLLPGERPDLRDVRIVVVDDEADARALVTRLLEDCGARVSAAGSAEEALSLVQEKHPAVLVSDIGMPGMDGYTLIRKVRTLGADRGGGTPAVALTAYARSEDRMRAVMAGFQMHVAKPVEAAELLTMVASLAGRMKA